MFVTVFEDGLTIPWRSLSVGQYIKYVEDYERGIIPLAILEDEIFQSCVVDDTVKRQMDSFKAGIVSTVVKNIWDFSGPQNTAEFKEDLDVSRQRLNSRSTRTLHYIVQVISMAFPYKPEEVYDMPYDTFLLRLVQAEKKLLELGLISEELSFVDEAQKEEAPPKKPKVDAAALWKKHQEGELQEQKVASETGGKWWEVSPVLENRTRDNPHQELSRDLDLEIEKVECEQVALTGHERADLAANRVKMVEDSLTIYKDLIEKLNQQ